jgi:hypothetical protein
MADRQAVAPLRPQLSHAECNASLWRGVIHCLSAARTVVRPAANLEGFVRLTITARTRLAAQNLLLRKQLALVLLSRAMHGNVTQHPTTERTTQQFRMIVPRGRAAPVHHPRLRPCVLSRGRPDAHECRLDGAEDAQCGRRERTSLSRCRVQPLLGGDALLLPAIVCRIDVVNDQRPDAVDLDNGLSFRPPEHVTEDSVAIPQQPSRRRG